MELSENEIQDLWTKLEPKIRQIERFKTLSKEYQENVISDCYIRLHQNVKRWQPENTSGSPIMNYLIISALGTVTCAHAKARREQKMMETYTEESYKP